jgi:hypothetical protein
MKKEGITNLILKVTPYGANYLADALQEGFIRIKKTYNHRIHSFDINEYLNVEISIMRRLSDYVGKAALAGAYNKKTLERMCIKVEDWVIKRIKNFKKSSFKKLMLKLNPYEARIFRCFLSEGIIDLRKEKQTPNYRPLAVDVKKSIKIAKNTVEKIDQYLSTTSGTGKRDT